MEANGEVTDLVAKSVCLSCVRAKGCGLWKLYTNTGCNQTKDITIPIVLGNVSIEVRPSLQVWLKLCPNCEDSQGQGRNNIKNHQYRMQHEMSSVPLKLHPWNQI